VQGTYYYSGAFSRAFFPNGSQTRLELLNSAIFLCDYSIEDHRELFAVMKVAHDAGVESLIIIARDLSEKAVGLLTTNNKMDTFTAIGVKLPGLNEADRLDAIEDISLLTGAKPHLKVLGDNLEKISASDLGSVRRSWADLRAFGFVGGRGDKRQLREHLHRLKRQYHTAQDSDNQKRFQKRIGNLLGGSATLWIGGFSETEINTTKSVVDRTVRGMRSAIQGGVVLGGGIALLHCRDILEQKLKITQDTDERAAYRLLIEALATPARTIFANAGYDPSEVMAQLNHENNETGFDVETGHIVNICANGIFDSLEVVKTSIRNAISTAALALTIDVLVHKSSVEMVKDPS
jgi:chaperonin GroEL